MTPDPDTIVAVVAWLREINRICCDNAQKSADERFINYSIAMAEGYGQAAYDIERGEPFKTGEG